ncbi:methyl-accepting chemotaxis protein [Paenibacillus phyllosphaerae]|uniref:Methyl-accepting chemotaxis protein n=1 Tax=Paenibacillus phyllosphaerae TaxID=274593 RepID=A0A7W5AUH4_9BACL|nr:methyl-accepting chemotaxis protein [Paenibacillus phyllosphaerae]MBB3108774.1 methyl-accepting chemotaxis protein [Paenibacillus phyllosphaerae]
MGFRSINSRMLATLLPIVLLTLIGLAWYISHEQQATLYEETKKSMDNGTNRVINQMMIDINAHNKLVESMARELENNPYRSKDELQNMVKAVLPVNGDSFGLGFFYIPYAYDPEKKLYSVYGYKADSDITFTEAYNEPANDYTNLELYKEAMSTDKTVVISDPYFDEPTQSTLVTFSAPFFDESKKRIGAAMGDINLNNLQAYVSQITVGDSGWAFLIDSKGDYLGHPNTDKMMKVKVTEEERADLAELGKSMLASEQGTGRFTDEKGLNQVFYQKIPELGWTLALVVPDAEWTKPVTDLRNTMLILSAVVLLILATAIVLFGRSVAKQARNINRLSRSLAEGDLSYRLQEKGRDEFGQIARNFNTTMDSLERTLGRVIQNSHTVAATSQQLSASADQTSRATEQIAESIAEIAEGSAQQVEQTTHGAEIAAIVSATVSEVASNVDEVTQASVQTKEEALSGSGVVHAAVDQMNVIEQRIQAMSRIIDTLGSKSKQIDGIVTIITDISGQTHLLALNAAIEAARAGDYGREFAVVADEVRKLADESTEAAEQIRKIITDIQSDTKRAVSAVSEGNAALTDGISKVHQTGEAFEGIRGSIEQLTDQTQQAQERILHVHSQMHELVDAINGIAKIARESADSTNTVASSAEQQNASMEEVASASAMLTKMAEDLIESVGAFKLSGT